MLSDLLKLQLDIAGARIELAATLLGSGFLSRAAAVAERETPVITIPGFLASDDSLIQLNRFLIRQGFRAESWGLGRNLGPQGAAWDEHLDETGKALAARVESLAERTGERPVFTDQQARTAGDRFDIFRPLESAQRRNTFTFRAGHGGRLCRAVATGEKHHG